MKRNSKPRKTTTLSDSLHQQLNMYALAATAAGVGMLSVPQPAEGKIVYTAAHLQLLNQQDIYVDLNHDGINDFSFYGRSISRRSISTFYFRLTAAPAIQPNAIWGIESNEHASCAARVTAGRQIGSERPFQVNRVVLFDWSGGPNGGTAFCPWAGRNGTAYLGLKFKIKGKTHFGWARVKVSLFNGKGATLTGYAYETVAGKPIKAGQTKETPEEDFGPGDSLTTPIPDTPQAASLGMLALGDPGVSLWRQKEKREAIRQ